MGNGKMGNGKNVNLFETLEGRRLLSTVALSSGVLKITGDASSANRLSVHASGSNLIATHNGATKSYSASSVNLIELIGGSAADNLNVRVNKNSIIRGNGGNDTLSGGDGKDTIYGGSGNDKIYGNGGDDNLRGEDGNDTIYGESGNDTLDGGNGTDVLYDEQYPGGVFRDDDPTPSDSGSENTVSLSGGVLKVTGHASSANRLSVHASGSNLIATHNGATKSYSASSVNLIELIGGSAADNLNVRVNKNSIIRGNGGNDTLSGGDGKDTIYGGSGNDKIYGNGGDDNLRGEDGNDTIYGESGNDTLDGGNGTDVLYDEQYPGGVLREDGTTPTVPPDDNDGGSVPLDGSATAPKPVITAQDTSIMAGQSIHVHGVTSSLGSGSPQNALYKWDFGDSGSEYNTLHGFNAAHHYADPGTYTVKLTITNQAGKSNQTSITVRVASDTRKVIYVAGTGSDSNSGSQSNPIKSWSKAASLARNSDGIEILFRRGDTFNADVNFGIEGDNVVVGAYGSGSRPVIRWTANVSGFPTIMSPRGSDITVRDLTFTSNVSNQPQALRVAGDNITVLDNEFYGLGYAVNSNSSPDGLLVQGNSAPRVDGIKSYFVWGSGTDHVYLGNTVANSREEHAIRVSGGDRVLIWDNDLTNTTGQVSGDNTPKGALTLHKGSYYWVAQNRLNKGPVAIGPLGNGDGLSEKGSRFRYGVFDGNVFDTKVAIDHGAERIMFRNNVVKSGDTAILVEGYNSSYGRTTNDVTIVNNTVINGNSSGRFVRVQKGAVGVSLANNLYVAPKLITGSMASGSVNVEDSGLSSFKFIDNNVWADATATLWAQNGQNYVWPHWSNQAGYRDASEWNAFGAVGTDVFSDVAVNSNYAPTSSSVVNSTGDYHMGVFHDLNGKIRDDWTAGAVEL